MHSISSTVVKRIIRLMLWLNILAACHAMAAPVSFKVASFSHVQSGKTFTLFNVHNDYSSKDNRIKTSQTMNLGGFSKKRLTIYPITAPARDPTPA